MVIHAYLLPKRCGLDSHHGRQRNAALQYITDEDMLRTSRMPDYHIQRHQSVDNSRATTTPNCTIINNSTPKTANEDDTIANSITNGLITSAKARLCDQCGLSVTSVCLSVCRITAKLISRFH